MNFPSDLYIFQGIIDLLGQQHQLEVVASRDGIHGPAEAL
jgi:kynureninase